MCGILANPELRYHCKLQFQSDRRSDILSQGLQHLPRVHLPQRSELRAVLLCSPFAEQISSENAYGCDGI